MKIKITWIFHSNATNPLTSNVSPVHVGLKNYCHILEMALRPYISYIVKKKAGVSDT